MAIFCAGFCIIGGQTASNALAATFYPTAIRSTGAGWRSALAESDSIVGPLIGGIMLSASNDQRVGVRRCRGAGVVQCSGRIRIESASRERRSRQSSRTRQGR